MFTGRRFSVLEVSAESSFLQSSAFNFAFTLHYSVRPFGANFGSGKHVNKSFYFKKLSNFYENCSSERMEAQRSETTVATMKTRPMATTKTSLRLCPRCRPRRPRPYPIKSVVVVP